MNKTILAPLLILAYITGILTLIAGTNLFDPLIKFIHSDTINPIEAGTCLVLTVTGFVVSYFLLNILCNYFVPRMKAPGKTATYQRKHAHKSVC